LTTVCEVPGQPSGLGFAPDGALLVVSMLDQRLLRLNNNKLVEVAALAGLVGGPANDMVIDAVGRAYIGNFGPGAELGRFEPTNILRVDPSGDVGVAADNLLFPNGSVLSPDGRTLHVAETFASRISAFNVAPDGTLSGRRTWAQFPAATTSDLESIIAAGVTTPDGMCLDAEGALWIGNATGSGALRVQAGGHIVERVETGDVTVFAVALGGEDRRTLYMCAGPALGRADPAKSRAGTILSCRVTVPGAGRP
jgi:sugar lactone lactonase YvrE